MDSEAFLKICQAKQEIQRLLQEKPELRPLQEKIDALMAGAGNQHNRCVLLSRMMHDKVIELGEALKPLRGMLGELQANAAILRSELEKATKSENK